MTPEIIQNDIQRKAIGTLLDGRYFVIPSYQRGYRWKKKQIYDLLNDLYTFICESSENQSKEDRFYCLQPIIVQELNSDEKKKYGCPEDKPAWEVVDGQQRLTSIFILLKYLYRKLRYDEQSFKEDFPDIEYFHLKYETREDSESFFDAIEGTPQTAKNIDYAYILNAFQHIDQWFTSDEGAKLIFSKHSQGKYSPKEVYELFRALLFCEGLDNKKSVQFIWYELSENESEATGETVKKNPINEFVRINNGKIALTNAELIKGLFLLSKNFDPNESEARQIQLAMEWESIENELHKDDFWYFIRHKEEKGKEKYPNRIDYLFSLQYKVHHWNDTATLFKNEKEEADNIKRLDQELSDNDKLFRYYYDLFSGKEGPELRQTIHEQWKEVLQCFRTICDWYNDAEIYNYIGFLSQAKTDPVAIYMAYKGMNSTDERADFIRMLQERVKRVLSKVKITPVEELKNEDTDDEKVSQIYPYGRIESNFENCHSGLYYLLLFLNINLLNTQLANVSDIKQKDSSVFKFPFDVFVSQSWDIEHIDSFTTNPLQKKDDQKKWVEAQVIGLRSSKYENKLHIVEELLAAEKYKEAIEKLREIVDEDKDASEAEKNGVGNLTLLDSVTNRQYHNDLFFLKRERIMDKIQSGVFVPTTTMYAFAKLYDKSSKDLQRWGKKDKTEYHNFIAKTLSDYIK